MTNELLRALSRLAGNRHSDGVSSLVTRQDRETIINTCHDMMLAARQTPAPKDRAMGVWRPIAEADSAIAYIHDVGGMRIGNSYPIWVRDDDGRIYQALWSDNGQKAYWWDIKGESPVDPVEFMPHPLASTDEEISR